MALTERCIVLAREGRIIDQLARSLTNLNTEFYPNDLVRASALADESVEASWQVGTSSSGMLRLMLSQVRSASLRRPGWN